VVAVFDEVQTVLGADEHSARKAQLPGRQPYSDAVVSSFAQLTLLRRGFYDAASASDGQVSLAVDSHRLSDGRRTPDAKRNCDAEA
jgi:hypothetical protein